MHEASNIEIICMRSDFLLKDLHVEVYIGGVPHHEEQAEFQCRLPVLSVLQWSCMCKNVENERDRSDRGDALSFDTTIDI